MGADDPNSSEFERRAQEQRSGFAGEFVAFLMDNKKWWLAPILLTILALGALVLAGGSAATPFIYTLF